LLSTPVVTFHGNPDRDERDRQLDAARQAPVEVDHELMQAIVARRSFVGSRIQLVLREVLEVLDVAQRFRQRVRHAERRSTLWPVLHAAQERLRPRVAFHAET